MKPKTKMYIGIALLETAWLGGAGLVSLTDVGGGMALLMFGLAVNGVALMINGSSTL